MVIVYSTRVETFEYFEQLAQLIICNKPMVLSDEKTTIV